MKKIIFFAALSILLALDLIGGMPVVGASEEHFDQSIALNHLDLVQLEGNLIGQSESIDLNQTDLLNELHGLAKRLHLGTYAHGSGIPTLRLSVKFVPIEDQRHIAYATSLELWQSVKTTANSPALWGCTWSDRRLFAVPDNEARKRVLPIIESQLDKFAEDYKKAKDSSCHL